MESERNQTTNYGYGSPLASSTFAYKEARVQSNSYIGFVRRKIDFWEDKVKEESKDSISGYTKITYNSSKKYRKSCLKFSSGMYSRSGKFLGFHFSSPESHTETKNSSSGIQYDAKSSSSAINSVSKNMSREIYSPSSGTISDVKNINSATKSFAENNRSKSISIGITCRRSGTKYDAKICSSHNKTYAKSSCSGTDNKSINRKFFIAGSDTISDVQNDGSGTKSDAMINRSGTTSDAKCISTGISSLKSGTISGAEKSSNGANCDVESSSSGGTTSDARNISNGNSSLRSDTISDAMNGGNGTKSDSVRSSSGKQNGNSTKSDAESSSSDSASNDEIISIGIPTCISDPIYDTESSSSSISDNESWNISDTTISASYKELLEQVTHLSKITVDEAEHISGAKLEVSQLEQEILSSSSEDTDEDSEWEYLPEENNMLTGIRKIHQTAKKYSTEILLSCVLYAVSDRMISAYNFFSDKYQLMLLPI